MITELKSISAIWNSNERISTEQCSKLILDFLILLNDHNEELFSKWYLKGRSKKDSSKYQIVLSTEYFNTLLSKKINVDNEDLGMRLSFWTGGDSNTTSSEISFRLGAYGDKSFNKNSCILDIPENSIYKENGAMAKLLIELITDFWKPDKLLINGDIFNKETAGPSIS